ncbi:MAG: hypothetical protein AB2L07_12445 [Thermoanaerobaculaceae bacterium]
MRSAVAVAPLLLAALAGAQVLPGSVEVGVSTGRLYGGSFAAGATRAFAGRTEVDDQILKGAWLATPLSPRLGLELALRRSSTALVDPGAGIFASQRELAEIDIATLEALALWSFPRGFFCAVRRGRPGDRQPRHRRAGLEPARR